MSDVLSIRGITKAFGTERVLQGVDLDVAPGTITAILGPSGCGKTTLLRVLAGFERPDDGHVRYGDRVLVGAKGFVPAERRGIGYVAQEGALFPHLSVAANVMFGMQRHERRQRHRVAELLDIVGLEPAFADRHPHQLSGGQQQRVAVARALAPQPEVVLLDEPFSSLDSSLRDETRRAVSRALAATATTAILVTHDQPEALSLSVQVAVMRAGRFAQVGEPGSVYRCPADLATARFLGDTVVLTGSVHAGVATCALGRLPVANECPPGDAQVLIRPEQITVHRHASAVENHACVAAVAFYGPYASVTLSIPGTGAAVESRVSGLDAPAPGEAVRLTVHGAVCAYPATHA